MCLHLTAIPASVSFSFTLNRSSVPEQPVISCAFVKLGDKDTVENILCTFVNALKNETSLVYQESYLNCEYSIPSLMSPETSGNDVVPA